MFQSDGRDRGDFAKPVLQGIIISLSALYPFPPAAERNRWAAREPVPATVSTAELNAFPLRASWCTRQIEYSVSPRRKGTSQKSYGLAWLPC